MLTVLATLPDDQRTQAGLFFISMSTQFSKPATSIPEQIALLRSRGLIIEDETLATHCLQHIGYYRLAGYWKIFQVDHTKHLFHTDITIYHIVELYNFDRELRLLLLDAIERIEVSFRSVLSNEMCCKYGPAWYADEKYAFNKKTCFLIREDIDRELDRSNEEFIKHHGNKYGKEEYPPAWKTMQVLSLGTLSKLYGNIHNDIPERRMIAKKYGLPAEAWLHSWMLVISVLRNYCAHHSRLCYRVFNFPPKDMRRPVLPWIKNMPSPGGPLSQHLYYQLCAVRYLLHTCSPDNHFNNRLKQLVYKCPSVEMSRMGFMPGWDGEDLWYND